MIKPSQSHKRVIYLSIASLWISGMVFLLNRYFLGNLFSLMAARSELQVSSMKIHGFLALVFIFVFGTVYSHFQRAWPIKKRRLSGLVLIGVLVILCLSAWPLYYSSVELTRVIVISVHCALGALLPIFIICHIASKGR